MKPTNYSSKKCQQLLTGEGLQESTWRSGQQASLNLWTVSQKYLVTTGVSRESVYRQYVQSYRRREIVKKNDKKSEVFQEKGQSTKNRLKAILDRFTLSKPTSERQLTKFVDFQSLEKNIDSQEFHHEDFWNKKYDVRSINQ